MRRRFLQVLSRQISSGRIGQLVQISEMDEDEQLDAAVPGARMWPLHDPMLTEALLVNIAMDRTSGIRSLCCLCRGAEFTRLLRVHYGEEAAFVFAWQSHYIHALALFLAASLPFIVHRTLLGRGAVSKGLLPQCLLSVLFGVVVTEGWRRKAEALRRAWRVHAEPLAQWQRLAYKAQTCSVEKRARLIDPRGRTPPRQRTPADELQDEQDEEENLAGLHRRTMSVTWRENLGLWPRGASLATGLETVTSIMHLAYCESRAWRVLKAFLFMPLLLAEWLTILAFFCALVWFEVWVIFDWGGCKKENEGKPPNDWVCMSADEKRGYVGLAFGALPSILEGIGFELLMQVSKWTADLVLGFYSFETREQRDFARVMVVFFLEVVGKVAFVCTLGIAFVPWWYDRSGHLCDENWDYALFGEWSLSCLKAEIPQPVRLKLFESCMKGPMLVSGLVSIGIKTLLPLLLELWRRCRTGGELFAGCLVCQRRQTRAGRCLVAPFDFVLRTCTLIFQADFGAVGGLRILLWWPPALRTPDTGEVTLRMRRRLWHVLLEGQRRKHDPFDESIELLLHFLWTSCFAIVWPLGTIFSLMNQLLELRSDSLKMLHVRGRRFPNSCQMCDVWVPLCSQIICYVSIAVNVVMALIPYQQYQLWVGPHSVDEEPFLAQGTREKLLTAFVVLSVMFALVRHSAVAASRCRPAGAPSESQAPSPGRSSPRRAESPVGWGAVDVAV